MLSYSSPRRLVFILLISFTILACSLPSAVITATATVQATLAPSATQAPGSSPSATPASPAATDTPVPQQNYTEVQIFLVALEDGGKSGPAVGCGDSLVEVKQEVLPTSEPIRAALEALFAIKQQHYGQSGLYNALWQSNLTVLTSAVDGNGTANVSLGGAFLLGGVCDSPRFVGQIEQTILAVPGVKATNVTINGRPIKEVLSEK